MMNPHYVVAVDATRARMYAVNGAPGAAGAPGPRLVEVEDLANPIRRMRAGEAFTDSRPGSRSAVGRGGAHAVDDHRDAHRGEWDRSFARDVMQAIADRTGDAVSRVLLIASPRMLGYLRESRSLVTAKGVQLTELSKEMTSLSAAQLQDQLQRKQLIDRTP